MIKKIVLMFLSLFVFSCTEKKPDPEVIESNYSDIWDMVASETVNNSEDDSIGAEPKDSIVAFRDKSLATGTDSAPVIAHG